MRREISGGFHAKQAAMWEGPFERFVWMDSDAIVWGDFTGQVRNDVDFQILWSEISIPEDATAVPGWLSHYYFDLSGLLKVDPEFEWRGLPYFFAGAYISRRNAFSFEEYLALKKLSDRTPGLFAFGDMGILNYLVHSRAQKGSLKVATTDLQHAWVHHGLAEFEKDCEGCGWRFPEVVARPRIGHFCGRKPFVFDRHSYSKPFTIARLEHYRRSGGRFRAWRSVLQEEALHVGRKLRSRIRRFGKS